MAWEWLGRVRQVVGQVRDQVRDGLSQADLASLAKGVTNPAVVPPPPPPPTHWFAPLARLLPLAMLLSGGLLAAFSEAIGIWAILGYMLVVASPVVYWLQRIEARLAELIHVNQYYLSRRISRE